MRRGLPARHVVNNIWKQHASQCVTDISLRHTKGAAGSCLTLRELWTIETYQHLLIGIFTVTEPKAEF